MRILHFSRDYTPHDHRFLVAMAASGHETLFLRLENGAGASDDRPLPAGVTTIPWAGGRRPVTWQDGPRLLLSLRKVLAEYKPDLIQAGPIQRCAFLAALAGYCPLIAFSWGYDLLHDAARGPSWSWATRFTLKRSAAFVGDCATIRDLAETAGMDPLRIVTFPWGADLQRFTPGDRRQNTVRERKGWGPECFVLLSTRNWAPLYGIEDLAEAFVSAAGQRPELCLLMLGGGPLSGRIKEIFTAAGMIDRVHFPGQVSQAALPEYYRAADLYISTSHSDGTSISLLEALASGTPVLLTDIPGNREWIEEPGREGWLFPDGQAPALTAAILNALDRRSELPAMGRAARGLAEQRGDWEKNFPHLFKAWEIALAQC